MLENNQIIITSKVNKFNLLKRNNQKLHNNKIYSLDEFIKLYYFTYNEETLYYIMNKYSVKYEIAKIYINNLYYLENTTYNSSKLNFLLSLKQDLYNNKLLKNNKLFLNYLNNKNILFYNLPSSKENEKLFRQLSLNNKVLFHNEEQNNFKHSIYELNNIEDEVVFVANKICHLIKEGISIKNIYLTNLNDDYRRLIKRIFPMFNIPYTLENNESIYGTKLVTDFFKLYNNDLKVTLDQLKSSVKTEETEDIYNMIINIINKYYFVKDKEKVIEMIKCDLKNTKIPQKDTLLSVHETNLKETIFNDQDYVFILSFNQGIIPQIYKDEEYLSDKERTELSISLTIDKNNLEKDLIKNQISSIKNACITYKKTANGEDFTISSLNEVLNYEVITITELDLNNNNLYNKIKLASLLDEYYKYGTKSSLLSNLYHHYQDLPYKTYEHQFTGIDHLSLQEYLGNKLTLSYSSLDKYYRCPFSYYIGNILKLNIYEETFYQLVGTLFHSILEKITKTTLSYDELWNQELKALDHSFNTKEQFFLDKLKKELSFIIEVIKEQEKYTNLHDELHEERVYVNLTGSIKITFTGIIDKIKYKEEDNQTIIAIIDYKTGNPNLDLTTIPYGIGMQLPVYLYLAKNSPKLKNIKVAGFYLQKILNNEVAVDNTHSYEQLKKKNLLLQGFSNSDLSILSEFDSSYMDSNIIKSMKVKKDNSFYHYCKVLDNQSIEKITKIAEDKINEGAKEILDAQFSIAPKKIGKTNYGCSMCKFKDICFHTNDDIIELKELNKEDIIGGEINGVD